MKFLLVVFISIFSVGAQAKVVFEGVTQDDAALGITLKENLFGKRTVLFRGERYKVAYVDENINVVQLRKTSSERLLYLVLGDKDAVDLGIERITWGQGWNRTALEIRLGALVLSGNCDTSKKVFKGAVFIIDQPDEIDAVACLRSK